MANAPEPRAGSHTDKWRIFSAVVVSSSSSSNAWPTVNLVNTSGV